MLFWLQYEKAAAELSSQSLPIFLAKIDASEESNKGIANEYKIQGFPTIKILRKGGKSIQDYNGPREAAGIVTYVKKQSGPASAEIKSADGAAEVIGEKSVVAVSESVSHVITFSHLSLLNYCNRSFCLRLVCSLSYPVRSLILSWPLLRSCALTMISLTLWMPSFFLVETHLWRDLL